MIESEPQPLITEAERAWETRDKFRRELLNRVENALGKAEHKVDGGPEDGVAVVTDRAWREALFAIRAERLPAVDNHYAEVLTGALVTVWARCPRCGIANAIAMSVDPVLTIETHTAELKLKAKAKARSHVCGQLTLPESASQATLDVEIESLVDRVHDLLVEVAALPGEEDGEDMPSIDTIRGWDRPTIDQVAAWAEAVVAQRADTSDPALVDAVPPLPRVLGGEADPEPVGEEVIAEDGADDVVQEDTPAETPAEGERKTPAQARADVARKRAARLADRVIPAETSDDDILPGENLGACPWPGCELAVEHPGAHQTAVDDTPDAEGA